MSENSQEPSQNLEFLKNVIQRKEHGEDFYSDQFIKIADQIRDALSRQASDDALNALAHGAIELDVSDVHLEIHEHFSTVLFRIDGELAQVTQLTHKEHNHITQRLKYRSALKLNITNTPQDGKFRLGETGREAKIDIRVSTLPTRYGESVVCRVLDSQDTILSFDGLGISWHNKQRVQKSMQKKQGMILVTGPTGSGKTTTLYTLINELNTSKNKIITLEDPIEYQIDGVLQSEINEGNGYTFASGVRSILRHDPDIIMIGEIRDLPTANTAVQSSLTGHLVLSTLHTKSSFETVERLLNMGVARYDLASALDIIIAQRLVRKICTSCCITTTREKLLEHPIIQEVIERLGRENIVPLLTDAPYHEKGEGCSHCGNTGYHGRTGIFEVFQVTESVRELIRSGKSSSGMQKTAIDEGFYTFRDDGVLKVLQGVTDMEELYRVIDL